MNRAEAASAFVVPETPAGELVLPATNEDETDPPVSVSFLTLFPLYSTTNANVPSEEMSMPLGPLKAALVPTPLVYAAEPVPAIVTTLAPGSVTFLIRWLSLSINKAWVLSGEIFKSNGAFSRALTPTPSKAPTVLPTNTLLTNDTKSSLNILCTLSAVKYA